MHDYFVYFFQDWRVRLSHIEAEMLNKTFINFNDILILIKSLSNENDNLMCVALEECGWPIILREIMRRCPHYDGVSLTYEQYIDFLQENPGVVDVVSYAFRRLMLIIEDPGERIQQWRHDYLHNTLKSREFFDHRETHLVEDDAQRSTIKKTMRILICNDILHFY